MKKNGKKTQGVTQIKGTKKKISTTTKATLVKGVRKPRFTQPILKLITPTLNIPKS